MDIVKALENGIYSGFIDHQSFSLEKFRPRLLINNSQQGQKVSATLLKELRSCDEFCFSVAFITESGLTVLLDALKELEEKNVKGRIITSTYLNFTCPKALSRLLSFKNIDLRVLSKGNHHAKGYIFRKNRLYSVIVGSSNLTQDALGFNNEWNLKISSMERGSIAFDSLNEFEKSFQNAIPLTEAWIHNYEQVYMKTQDFTKRWTDRKEQASIDDSNSLYEIGSTITPNKMQIKALEGIDRMRRCGEKKSLLISATGTGKTYLSAFDVKRFTPKRLLFIAHREQLLNQSIQSFREVLGEEISVGKFTGNCSDVNSQYLFSTVQTVSKIDSLERFDPDTFDYIIIDESHRVGAESYQRILNYFKPSFLLGMTATPERTDEHNVCADFDYNIAYEIRLREAMEEDMLCPFHYFGVSEVRVNGELINDKAPFNNLISDERLKNILEKISFYGHQGNRVRGLIFCSRNEEAEALSSAFNDHGYRTVALSGKDTQARREEMIRRLESSEKQEQLDYIFTVDIFNEGVDIPSINQIVMLRPTQSAIVFVQQLGRGLRKLPGKEFVVIIDFIGNYKNNFMIPMALSDDRSFNKDTIRRYAVEGSRVIPGASTISFDEIAKRRIFEAIDEVNFASVSYIKESYKNLKFRLGRIPKLMDFEIHDSIDLEVLFNSSIGSYYHFLVKYEKAFSVRFDNEKERIIEFVSRKFAVGKRPHELLAIRAMIQGLSDPLATMKDLLTKQYGIIITPTTSNNVINVLTNDFAVGTGGKKFNDIDLLDGKKTSESFLQHLTDDTFKAHLLELVEYGLYRSHEYYGNRYNGTSLCLYSKYSYDDVCRLLEWEKGAVSLNIGGYKYDEKTGTYPVFINYDKSEDIESSIKYEDRFVSPSRIIAISKSGRSLESNDVQTALRSKKLGIRMELFVRKNKDDKGSKEFYYLGRINPTGETQEFVMEEAKKSAVEITYDIDTPVKEDIYEYFVEV